MFFSSKRAYDMKKRQYHRKKLHVSFYRVLLNMLSFQSELNRMEVYLVVGFASHETQQKEPIQIMSRVMK